jgi:hypothetical protein
MFRKLCATPPISVLAVLCGFALTGLVIQVANNFVNAWSVNTLFLLLLCLVPVSSFVASRALDTSSLPSKSNKFPILKLSLVPILGFLLLCIVLRFSRSISFLHLLGGEDNSKWINGIHQLLDGNISAGDMNGISAPLVLLLLTVAYSLQLVSHLCHFNMSTTEVTILTPFTTALLLIFGVIFVIRSKVRWKQDPLHSDQSPLYFRLQSTFPRQILVVTILLTTATFGFLTFSYALLVVAIIAKILPSISTQDKSHLESRIALALLLFICGGFIWLPLSILFAPIELLLFVALFKHLIKSGRWSTILFLVVTSVFIYYKFLLPRFQYFFTDGSGGQSMWRELALSGGGTPKITIAFLICTVLLLLNQLLQVADTDLSSYLSFKVASALLVCYSVIAIAAGSLGNGDGYAVTKIGLFILVSILLLLGELPQQNQIRFAPKGLSFLIVLVLSLSGDLTLSYNRVVDPLTISNLSETDRAWVRVVLNELEETGTAPVGCLTITSTGALVKPENSRDYLCTRILTNLAGGEERLIGLHAFTTGVFNASQMYGSLEHYLGTNLEETVLLFSEENNNFVKRVSLRELENFVNMSS